MYIYTYTHICNPNKIDLGARCAYCYWGMSALKPSEGVCVCAHACACMHVFVSVYMHTCDFLYLSKYTENDKFVLITSIPI